MRWLEQVAVSAGLLLGLTQPTLPCGWNWMVPGYFVMVAAFDGFLRDPLMSWIAIGFLAAVASVVLAFLSKWGVAGGLAVIGWCVFAVAVLVLLSYKSPIGVGLWTLLVTLAAHSFFSLKWHLQRRKNAPGLPRSDGRL